MKIIAPLRSLDQVNMFVDMGADEFYGGLIYNPWIAKFGKSIEYNRRGNFDKKANFASLEEFAQMLALLKNLHKGFSLTANAIRVSKNQLAELSQLFSIYKELGGKHVIVTDVSVIELARDMGMSITVSSCACVKNSATVNFYKKYNVEKIIFPRDITFSEMGEIIRLHPDITYEAFLINSACKFIDGCCLGLHDTQYGSLCAYIDQCENDFHFKDFPNSDYSFKCKQNNFFYKNLLKNACGYCAIYDLLKIGINSFKIVGRLISTDTLSKQISKTKEFVDIAKHCHSRGEYLDNIEDSFSLSRCRNGFNCYYPEIMRIDI